MYIDDVINRILGVMKNDQLQNWEEIFSLLLSSNYFIFIKAIIS